MTTEQQRIKIAEACGYGNIEKVIIRNVTFQGDDRELGIWSDKGWIPDYPNDLNAMHEAEIAADLYSYPRRERYLGRLQDIINAEGTERPFMCATAAQRAEAFLKTLGLWKE
jgi:hypothetical protein